MSPNPYDSGRSTPLFVAGVYFVLCGVSAIFWPSSWHTLAGLEPKSLDLPLAVVGVMMLSLGAGAFLAKSSLEQRLVTKLYLAANAGDAIVVVFYTAIGTLPLLNGSALALVDLIWIAVLGRTIRNRS